MTLWVPEILLPDRAAVGEAILWSAEERCLWWIDIRRQSLHRLDPESGCADTVALTAPPGLLAISGEGLLVGLPDGLHLFDPAEGRLRLRQDGVLAAEGMRYNDSAVTRDGRLFAGFMPLGDRSLPLGCIVRHDRSGARLVRAEFHVPNGLAVSPGNDWLYVSDSWPERRRIWRHAYDPDAGTIGQEQLFFDTHGHAGRPDGATVDAEGCYWMAGVGGGSLLRITPAGHVDRRIPLPASHPTKPCFGGTDLRTIFVTTLGPDSGVSGIRGPCDGALLAIRSDVPGIPEPIADLGT